MYVFPCVHQGVDVSALFTLEGGACFHRKLFILRLSVCPLIFKQFQVIMVADFLGIQFAQFVQICMYTPKILGIGTFKNLQHCEYNVTYDNWIVHCGLMTGF